MSASTEKDSGRQLRLRCNAWTHTGRSIVLVRQSERNGIEPRGRNLEEMRDVHLGKLVAALRGWRGPLPSFVVVFRVDVANRRVVNDGSY